MYLELIVICLLHMHADTYLSLGVGRSVTEGVFRVLTRGYTHVRSNMRLLMKPRIYEAYALSQKKNKIASVEVATCECAVGCYKHAMR